MRFFALFAATAALCVLANSSFGDGTLCSRAEISNSCDQGKLHPGCDDYAQQCFNAVVEKYYQKCINTPTKAEDFLTAARDSCKKCDNKYCTDTKSKTNQGS